MVCDLGSQAPAAAAATATTNSDEAVPDRRTPDALDGSILGISQLHLSPLTPFVSRIDLGTKPPNVFYRKIHNIYKQRRAQRYIRTLPPVEDALGNAFGVRALRVIGCLIKLLRRRSVRQVDARIDDGDDAGASGCVTHAVTSSRHSFIASCAHCPAIRTIGVLWCPLPTRPDGHQ